MCNIMHADAMLATNEEQYTALHYAAFYMPPYQVALDSVDGGQSENQEVEDDLDDGRRMMKYILEIAKVDVSHCRLALILFMVRNVSLVP